MPEYKQINASDNQKNGSDNEPEEMVGSANLKEVLQERGFVRGSFSINGTQYRDFEARSPGEVVSKINAQPSNVIASLDDGFHLVLESRGGPIKVGSGAAYDKAVARDLEVSRQRQAQVAGQVPPQQQTDQQRRAAQSKDQPKQDDDNDIVKLLGLNGDDESNFGIGESTDWQPGMNAEDRKKSREERMKNAPNADQNARTAFGGANAADEYSRALAQGSRGGGTTQMNRGPSDTSNADPSNPPGYPKGPNADGKPKTQEGLAPPQHNLPGSRTNPGVEGLGGQ